MGKSRQYQQQQWMSLLLVMPAVVAADSLAVQLIGGFLKLASRTLHSDKTSSFPRERWLIMAGRLVVGQPGQRANESRLWWRSVRLLRRQSRHKLPGNRSPPQEAQPQHERRLTLNLLRESRAKVILRLPLSGNHREISHPARGRQ